MEKELTSYEKRQQKVNEKFIVFYTAKENQRPPNYESICKHMGWASKGAVSKKIVKLKKLGLI